MLSQSLLSPYGYISTFTFLAYKHYFSRVGAISLYSFLTFMTIKLYLPSFRIKRDLFFSITSYIDKVTLDKWLRRLCFFLIFFCSHDLCFEIYSYTNMKCIKRKYILAQKHAEYRHHDLFIIRSPRKRAIFLSLIHFYGCNQSPRVCRNW